MRRGSRGSRFGPILDPRRGLPKQPELSPPARGERVLLRPDRGFSGPRRSLPCYLAPEHWVRTWTAEIKPDGFGRYLHPGGACEFYLEYDRGTEAFGALSAKLGGYLQLAAGWTGEDDLTRFPNLLFTVPEKEREEEVGSALRHAIGRLHVRAPLATSFPLYVASEDQLTECGSSAPCGGTSVPTAIASRSWTCPRGLAVSTGSLGGLGRYFTDADAGQWRRISPVSAMPRFPALPPRHGP